SRGRNDVRIHCAEGNMTAVEQKGPALQCRPIASPSVPGSDLYRRTRSDRVDQAGIHERALRHDQSAPTDVCQEKLGDAKVATAGRESEVSQRVALSGNRALAFLTWTNIETSGGGQNEIVREWTVLPVAQVSCYRKGMVRGLVKAGDHGAEGPVGRCD